MDNHLEPDRSTYQLDYDREYHEQYLYNKIERLERELHRARAALKIIANQEQCTDNLFDNKGIAMIALAQEPDESTE